MAEKFAEIHIWMFNKIKLLNSWGDQLIELIPQSKTKAELKEQMEQLFAFPSGKLDEIIDHENIHQWLEEHLVQSERKLASIITRIHGTSFSQSELEDIFFRWGKEHKELIQPVWLKPSYIYRTVTDALTEGMPCDKANQVISHDENHLTWEIVRCMHQKAWEDEQGDVHIFYALRDAWIKGLIEDSDFYYTTQHPQYTIRRN